MRVLVCGDRNWTNYKRICQVLATLDIDTIIHGNADGVDKLAGRYALEHHIKIDKPPTEAYPFGGYPAAWGTFGKAAGPIRNKQMLTEVKPDLVVALHNYIENSKGTANMLKQANEAHVPNLLATSHGVKNDYVARNS